MRNVAASDLGPANRLTIYVVSNVKTVRKLAGDKQGFVAGFYVPRAGGSVAIIPRKLGDGSKWDLDPESVLLHEYAHHFLYQNFAGAYPAWFSEGFAEFHATAKFEDDGRVGLGIPPLHRGPGLLLGNPMTVEQLMAYAGQKLSPEKRESIYGRGWLLTHYLTFAKERRGQLTAYLAAINKGGTPLDAARASFGDLKKLDRELDTYLGSRKFSYVDLPVPAADPQTITVRELSAGQDALMEATIVSNRGVTRDQAIALLKEMRVLARPYPRDADVQASLAEAEYDAGNYREAEQAADRALAVTPKLRDALLYKGMARMKLSQGGDENAWKEVRRWFTAANRLDPDDPVPLILFYESFEAQGVAATPNAVTGLNYAFALAPEDRGLRLQVARQFLIDGKGKEARTVLGPIAYDPHAGEMGKWVSEIIDTIDASGAGTALEKWHEGPTQRVERLSS